ncbi:MAG: 1,4-alpha-glucan branching protein domain-containing protein [bacterium]
MARKSFSFFLHGHLPWVLGHGRWPHGAEWLCEAAVETWIPLVRALDRLSASGVRGGVTLSVSPVLAEQLAHGKFTAMLGDYLEDRERTAGEDAAKTWEDEPGRTELAAYWRDFYRDALRFLDSSGGDLLGELRRLADQEVIELATCGATHFYFPLTARDESIALQAVLARRTHVRRFGSEPTGMWLPECGYRPGGTWWGRDGSARMRPGVEELVGAAGIRWFVVDSALVSGGRALGSYPERTHRLADARRAARAEDLVRPIRPEGDTRYSYQVAAPGGDPSRCACFSRDPGTGIQVWCGDHGYPGDPEYLDFHKKSDTGGHRYWRITGPGVDLAQKSLYSPTQALERVATHADHFAHLVHSTLADTGDGAILCAPYDAELFGHWWFEGVSWIEAALSRLARDPDIALTTLGRHHEEFPPEHVLALPEGSWGEGGGHAVWRNPRVDWTWSLIDAAESEVWDLLGRTAGQEDLARRFALAALREFLLLGASDWAFLITTNGAPDYAADRLRRHAENVATCADAARRLLTGREPAADAITDLEKLEARNDFFPDLEPAVREAIEIAQRSGVGV